MLMKKYLIVIFLMVVSVSLLSRLALNEFHVTNYMISKYFDTFSPESVLKDGNGILLMETTDRMEPPSLVLCALESAARVYPDRPVVYFMKGLGNVTSEKEEEEVKDRFPSLRSYDNIYIFPMRLEELFDHTPLLPWWIKKSSRKEYPTPHIMSDACRIALVWKYGGLYTDTDVIAMRPIPHTTFLVPLREVELSCGLFAFPRFSNLTWWLMEDFVKNYLDAWAHNGPTLFTRVFKKYCGQPVINTTDTKCRDIPYLHPDRFYPIPYPAWRRYYSVWKDLSKFDFSYGLHVWSYMNQEGRTMEPGSNTLMEHLYQQYCPKTYEHVLNSRVFLWDE